MSTGLDLSVVVPCLNEEVNVGALAERLFEATDEARLATEIVFVDDGSTDGTWSAIEQCRREWGDRVVGVRHEENAGIAAAWRSGLGRQAVGTHASWTPTCSTRRRRWSRSTDACSSPGPTLPRAPGRASAGIVTRA